jgi:hypothetical protein
MFVGYCFTHTGTDGDVYERGCEGRHGGGDAGGGGWRVVLEGDGMVGWGVETDRVTGDQRIISHA